MIKRVPENLHNRQLTRGLVSLLALVCDGLVFFDLDLSVFLCGLLFIICMFVCVVLCTGPDEMARRKEDRFDRNELHLTNLL